MLAHGEMQVLIDPVCMFTIYPQLLRNFIYRLPRMQLTQGFNGIVDGLRYVLARNLVIAEAFGRKFSWHKVRQQAFGSSSACNVRDIFLSGRLLSDCPDGEQSPCQR